jgi:hypothetical protein
VELFGIVESQDHYETARVEIGRSMVVDEGRMLTYNALFARYVCPYRRPSWINNKKPNGVLQLLSPFMPQ